MTRLPTVGSDANSWGTVLNDYLTQNIPQHYTVSSGGAAGDTTIVLDKDVTGVFAGGSFIAIGATTTKCEIKRITAVSGDTITVNSTFKFSHSAGEFAWVLDNPWVPLEWYGCKADDSTYDSYVGLQAAFNDIALASGRGWGLTGHVSRYYSSKPLAINDNTMLKDAVFSTFSTFAIDATVGLLQADEPGQYFVMLGGQFVTVSSVDTSGDTITLSGSVGSSLGETMMFHAAEGATLPAPLEAGRIYFVKTNPSGSLYTISEDRDGTAIDFTTSGSGTVYVYSLGLSRMRWDGITLEGGTIPGLNGCMAMVQQPSVSRNLRIEGFSGPTGGLCLGGQQGDFYTPMFFNCKHAITLRSAQMMYFYGINVENCDVLVVQDTIDQYGGSQGTCRDVRFFGSHWETNGLYSCSFQNVVGDAAVSAGTFTLTFDGQTTGAIAYDASAATVQTALEALSNIASGDITCTDVSGGLASAGWVQVEFTATGAYQWTVVPIMTVDTTGLTGGTYTINYTHPTAAAILLKGGNQLSGLAIHGGEWSGAQFNPDGTGTDFLVLDTTGNEHDGYLLESVLSTSNSGNAVNDTIRGITVPWSDSTGCGERLASFVAGGYHGGTSGKNWWLAGRTGGHVVWSEYQEELRLNDGAKIRFGDTGPLLLSGSGTPEAAITAPVGSLYVCTDGGASTSLYVKESGTGNTGWVAK